MVEDHANQESYSPKVLLKSKGDHFYFTDISYVITFARVGQPVTITYMARKFQNLLLSVFSFPSLFFFCVWRSIVTLC